MTLTPEDIAAGWVEWGGGSIDADPAGTSFVEIMFSDGIRSPAALGNHIAWNHTGQEEDVYAYRIVQPAAVLEGGGAMAFLEFTFRDLPHFIGVFILTALVCQTLYACTSAIFGDKE